MNSKMQITIRIICAIVCLVLMGLWFATQVPRSDFDQFMQLSGSRSGIIKLPVFILLGIGLAYFWAIKPKDIKGASAKKRMWFAFFFAASFFVATFGLGILFLIVFKLKPVYI
jgi:hypothetical protein